MGIGAENVWPSFVLPGFRTRGHWRGWGDGPGVAKGQFIAGRLGGSALPGSLVGGAGTELH